MIPFYLTRHVSSSPCTISTRNGKNIFFKLYDDNHNDKFIIHFEGLKCDYIIGWKDELPPKIIAVSVNTNEHIMLFDGMVHGYDASIAGFFMGRKRPEKHLEIYKDEGGNNHFEVYLNFEYDSEYEGEPENEIFHDLFQAQRYWYISNGIKSVREMVSCSFLTASIILKANEDTYIQVLEEETA